MMETIVEHSIIDERAAQSATVRIADISISTVAEEHGMRLEATGSTRRFLVTDCEPDVIVSAAWAELDEAARGELVFDSGALWKLYREGNDYVFRFVTPILGTIPYKVASFNLDFTRGRVLMHRPYFDTERALYPLDYPLDELLMLNLLARGRGVELHSCGVVDEGGEGFLFLGQSGAGKTTTARLWEQREGVEILSDDRIILRRVDGKVCMYGTPWHGEGELACAGRAPLNAVFFLRHGERNELQPLSRIEAAARLFSCGFPTFYDMDGIDFTLAFFDEVTSDVPCYELSFVPDERAVDFVRQQAF